VCCLTEQCNFRDKAALKARQMARCACGSRNNFARSLKSAEHPSSTRVGGWDSLRGEECFERSFESGEFVCAVHEHKATLREANRVVELGQHGLIKPY